MIKKCDHIYLLGFMGCGKSTLGRILANQLHRPFEDTDILIEVKMGMSVTTIFQEFGEKRFRELELEVLHELVRDCSQKKVIALGGGTPAREEAWPLLKSSGRSVYLYRTPDQLHQHVRHSTHRPILQQQKENIRGHIQNLLHEREPYYRRADYIFICQDSWDVEETADRLIKLLEGIHEDD